MVDERLEDLAPPEVYPLIVNDGGVIVNGMDGNGTLAQVEIRLPDSLLEQNLLTLYLAHLSSADFLKRRPQTRYTRAITIRNFIEFTIRLKLTSIATLPKNIFDKYFAYLKKNSDKTSLYNDMLGLRTPIKDFLEGKFIFAQAGKGDISDYLSNMPLVPPPESIPKKSMADIFEKECPYTDKQLIDGLRLLCCVLLEELRNARKELQADDVVKNSIKRLCDSGLINHTYGGKVNFERSYKNTKLGKKDFVYITKSAQSIIDKVSKTKSPIIKELFLEGTVEGLIQTGSSTVEKIDKLFEAVVKPARADKFKIPAVKVILGSKTRIRTLKYLTPRFVAGPTDLEFFLVQCLLASDSIQRKGLVEHTLLDFSLNDGSLQIQYVKPRRNKGSTTAIYKRNTLIFEAYSRFISDLEQIQPWLPTIKRGKTLPYSTNRLFRGAIGFALPSLGILEVICKPESNLRNLILKKTRSEVKPILWLIDKIYKHNVEQAKLRGTGKKVNTVGLNPDTITMSRKRVDDRNVISIKNNEVKSVIEDENVSAELTAHSISTKKNTYNLRSKSKEKISSMRRFGEQVGELMEQDAKAVRDYIDSTKLVTRAELKKVLNITDISDEFEEMISAVDSDFVEVWGGIVLEETTFVVANDITAMLMFGFIEHIKAQLPELYNHSETRAQEAQVQLAYLSEIFHQFPAKVQKSGKNMLAEYNISYPSFV